MSDVLLSDYGSASLVEGDSVIKLFSGTPGSGKTLHAVHVMDWYNRRRRPVLSNFPLTRPLLKNPDLFFQLEGDTKSWPDFLVDYSRNYFHCEGISIREGQILLVLDECQLLFNTRDWQFNRAWISFFTQHRKLGYDVILIAQYDRMIERQIRALLEYECKHLKVSNLGGIWGFILPIIIGRYRVYEKWYGQQKMLISQYRASYSKRDKSLYDTFQYWD